MENKLIKVLSVVFALLLLFGMGVCIYCIVMSGENTVNIAECIGLAVVAAFGIYYILAGCKKGEGSTYFRWFVNMFALVEILPLLQHDTMSVVSVIMLTIGFGSLTVLSVGRDLGKGKSLLLSGIVIAITMIDLVTTIIRSPENVVVLVVIHLLLAITTMFMVFAKYADKKARGSK